MVLIMLGFLVEGDAKEDPRALMKAKPKQNHRWGNFGFEYRNQTAKEGKV